MAWRVSAHVLCGVAQGGLLFPRLSKPQRERRIQKWARTMLKRLGVELKVVGAPARVGPMLLVANHISWVDIVALHAVCHCRFVAKADVERWPLLGTLATGGGTLYVKRESRRDAMRVVHRMAQALKDGDILAVFPEGTTGDGSSVLPFHSGLIQAAISADAPVQPVALQIVDGEIREAQPGGQLHGRRIARGIDLAHTAARGSCAPWSRSARRNVLPAVTAARGRRNCADEIAAMRSRETLRSL